jgi:hypothetical protein
MEHMKPDISKQLEAVLDKRQENKRAEIQRTSEQQRIEAKNLVDFQVKKKEVIQPAFQEIVDLYQRRGVRILILEENEKPRDTGGFPVPNIRLDMTEAYSSTYGSARPEFRLSFEKRNGDVSLYTSTQSQAGPAGHVTLDDLTTDWIQSEFVKYQSRSY